MGSAPLFAAFEMLINFCEDGKIGSAGQGAVVKSTGRAAGANGNQQPEPAAAGALSWWVDS